MAPKKRILIVDDEETLRAITRIALKNRGFDVIEAENGRQGIEELERRRPDLIVLDLMMPEMNGLEFCTRMIDKLDMKDVPVLLFSAVSKKSGILQRFIQLPLDHHDYLIKPLDPRDLIAKVVEMVGEPDGAEGSTGPAAASPKPPRAPVAPPSSPRPASAARPAAGTGPTPDPKQPRFRILVIDDDEDIRTLLRTALGFEYDVHTAENGMHALSVIDEADPDFIIVDVKMPLMDGLETVEAIRRHPQYGGVPVFFLTGESDKNLPRKTYEVGGNLYLRKPIDPARLLRLFEYFIKESDLKPRSAKELEASRKLKAPAPSSSAARRVLTIDFKRDERELLEKLFNDMAHPQLELLWAEDARSALGNLKRWEPDVILYNPRNPGLDGIAFGQTLRLKKMDEQYKLTFVGLDFYPADKDYCRKNFGREVIDLTMPEAAILKALVRLVNESGRSGGAKRHSIDALLEEDRAHKERLRSAKNQLDRARDDFRSRFSKIQTFIDDQRDI